MSAATDELLNDLFWYPSHFDVFGFSDLHRAYLGISGIGFDQAISSTSRSDIDNADMQGRTLLSWAAQRGDDKTVARLLTHGADPNKPSRNGKNPLHWSSQSSNTKCMEVLLAAKADVHATDIDGTTALHCVANNGEGFVNLIGCLLKYGAEIEKQGKDGWTPLHSAVSLDEITVISELLAQGANVNAQTNNRQTALHFAVWQKSHNVLALLLRRTDLDFQIIDDDGWDIFHYAAAYADSPTLEILATQWPDIINLSKRDSNGNTAWQLASWRRNSNTLWSRSCAQPPDKDPLAHYRAFDAMTKCIWTRQQAKEQIPVQDTTIDLEGLTLKDTAQDRSSEDGEGLEMWEDALEKPV